MEITKAEADIGLVSANIEKAIWFYQDILGLKMGKAIPLDQGTLMHRFFHGNNLIKISYNLIKFLKIKSLLIAIFPKFLCPYLIITLKK